MKDNQIKEKFVELRASGKAYAAISIELGVSKQTLINWSKGLKTEIANMRNIELEALYKKHSVAKEQRVTLFSNVLSRITQELEKIDFSDLRTNELLQLVLKYGENLKTEESETIFASDNMLDADIFPGSKWSA